VLTPGECHDAAAFDDLLEAVPPDCRPDKAIADKGYDSEEIRESLRAEGMKPVIPVRRNAVIKRRHDKAEYKERNRIERFIGKLKQFRRIATRYDKLAATFMALVNIASAVIHCREFVNRT
jgi:transposase